MQTFINKTQPGMRLLLEIIITSFDNQMNLCYLTEQKDITDLPNDPDELVQEYIRTQHAERTALSTDKCIIHSTSWRYEKPQDLILTYLVFSDSALLNDKSAKVLCLNSFVMPENSDPARPRPETIRDEHVVVHGIRHISHLIKQKSQNISGRLSPQSILAFQQMDSELAGRFY